MSSPVRARSRTFYLAAVALASLAFGAGVAPAARQASQEEADAIGAAYDALPFCSDASISTVDSTYATWSLIPTGCGYRDPRDTGPEYPIVLAHQTNGVWADYYQSSDTNDACEAAHIPPAVGSDLHVCRPASKRIYVIQGGAFRYRPRTLVQGAHGAFVRLNWHGWGRPAATADGTFTYSDSYDHFAAPITARLSYVALCGSRRIYLHLKIAARDHRDRRRLRFATGTRELSCEPGDARAVTLHR
jgi:hypothetical protein